MSDPFSDEELAELAAVMAGLAALPEVDEGLRQRLYDASVHFLEQCVLAAKLMQQLGDPFEAQRVMTDATVWAVELRGRLAKEVLAAGRPRHTTGQFTY